MALPNQKRGVKLLPNCCYHHFNISVLFSLLSLPIADQRKIEQSQKSKWSHVSIFFPNCLGSGLSASSLGCSDGLGGIGWAGSIVTEAESALGLWL